MSNAIAPAFPSDEAERATLAHPAFLRKQVCHVPSLKLTVAAYEHRATGALHYHLDSDHRENVFLVAFRTAPMDSTGVAHVLEHTSLCGSARFPVRDPFFMMTRRSLNTFMNAFTSSDWTAYPFASKNRKDFNNLLQVYMDAAFYPNLEELDFAQEGHRLEFADPADPNSELLVKGVVYNEMKGAMSSPVSVLWHTMCRYLFPETTYHFNSGGDPGEIPKLGYQHLVNFHRRHYHPGNSVFMTFGDIPASEHQGNFEQLALAGFVRLDEPVHIADESRYHAPLRVEERYAVEAGDDGRKTHVVLGWLLGHGSDLEQQFRTQLLASVLFDNSASPLARALESSSLGTAPSPLCGLESSHREMSFLAGLEGCEANATIAVEKLILDTLEHLAENGVAQEQVEAALHQLELEQREISGGSYPYGLQLILAGLPAAIHRGDPAAMLDLDPVLAKLREQIRDPGFVPSLVRELLLDNPHRVTLTLLPDSQLAARRAEAEQRRLAAIRESLPGEQRKAIVERSRRLHERQMLEDDAEALPRVGLEDVPKDLHEPERQPSWLPDGGGEVSFFGQGTNGLAYQQVVFELPALADELLEVLHLYCACFGELGVGAKDYAEVQTWQASVGGGVNGFSTIRAHRGDVQTHHALFSVSAKCLLGRHRELAHLLRETIDKLRFDEAGRLRELLEQIQARKENSITSRGHALAINLACSHMSSGALLSHRSTGLESIRRLRGLVGELPEAQAQHELLERLCRLHKEIASSEKQFLLIGEQQHRERLLGELAESWSGAPAGKTQAAFALPALRERKRELWTTATEVNFCAKAWPTVSGDHADSAVLHVLARFINNGFLHRAIREQGGAYGSGASQNANVAAFQCFSYRDPRLQETLQDFDRALEWVVDGRHQQRQLEEAILGVIAAMDKPSSPAGEAKAAFYDHLTGRALEQRRAFRERALATTLDDLRRVVQSHFDPAQASFGIISSAERADELQIEGLQVVNL